MKTILFLCPHHAAKSIMAEAYFNHQAKLGGVPFQATSAGTEPSEQIWPAVIDLLSRENLTITPQIPRKVAREDLLQAFQVISLGCTPGELKVYPQHFIVWEDVPLASTDLEGSWMAIRRHIDALLVEFARTTPHDATIERGVEGPDEQEQALIPTAVLFSQTGESDGEHPADDH